MLSSGSRRLRAAAALVVLPAVLLLPAAGHAQAPLPTPTLEPTASPSAEPSDDPQPSESASPRPTASRTTSPPRRSPSPSPSASARPRSPSPSGTSATASPSEVTPTPTSTREPGPTVTGDLPLSTLSPDGEVTTSPEPVASSDGPSDPLVRAFQLALLAAAVLGLGGGAGLYLTRGSR